MSYRRRRRDESGGEWAKQLGRDGYSKNTKPVERPTQLKEHLCCDRVLRYYSDKHALHINTDVKPLKSPGGKNPSTMQQSI